MRLVLAALVAAFLLTACGTVAQVEPQQQGIAVSMVEPVSACHAQAEATEDAVVFTASEACSGGHILPFRIVAVDGPGILHDGGVYAGSTTVWRARPGTFNVMRGDRQLGTIRVP